ncbi:MAG TPA: DegT/DnrJ/EryC1/StrS family aminotransferase [Solirubrobacteraceae bacterium]|nr:DegT/DnrJ/EryC1/StrS family aminotransferase [Solirubrobacteraceae bacterium]
MSGVEPQIPLFDVRLSDSDIAAVVAALRSGWLTMGPRTESFEKAFADHLGARHAVAVSSGTAALHLAYLAAGVGPGDEVIVPALTFVATANAARYCGATPVFADVIGQEDLSVDLDHVRSLITARTRAVTVVHYGGYAADVRGFVALCEERGLALIEDAAHSPSANPTAGGPKLGTWGMSAAFSFFSNKVLGCGEGGLVATDDDEVARIARSGRAHAMTSGTWDRHRGYSTTYDVVDLGHNYRLDEPRAALLHHRLAALEEDIRVRRGLVHRYREMLSDVAGVTVPYRDEDVDHSSCYIMPVMVDEAASRDPLRELLRERGIQTSVLYPAVHEFTAYKDLQRPSLPRSELAARTQMTLPLYPHMSERDLERVVAGVRDGLASLRGMLEVTSAGGVA